MTEPRNAAELPISVSWSIANLGDPPEQWRIFINHMARFRTKVLQDLFFSVARPNVWLRDHPELRGPAEIMVREAGSFVPPIHVYEEVGVRWAPEGALDSITHYANWPDLRPSGQLFWVRVLREGQRRYSNDENSGSIPFSRLSAAALGAIRQFDGFATEVAYRRHLEQIRGHVGTLPVEPPPPQKTRVFISYRRTQLTIAKRLHRVLSDFGNCAHFDPFLDEHSPRLGNLVAVFLEQIDRSDIFMPIVSEDYAPPDTISRREYEHASHLASQRGWHDFIAPVRVGAPASPVATALARDFYLQIDGPDDLEPRSAAVSQFLRGCLAVARRAS